uniref:ATP synthase CF1 subunit delta n=1 Tax=Catenella fusiformis TaxID=3024791 RepID=UPI0027D9D236|nr:ATP synthase CF1 subunit delta [Catenella fusiformis]WCH57515.1 ATP synthase CF1 subunit delta [Catenella fusiformis]
MSRQSSMIKVALPYAEALLEYARKNQLINEVNESLTFISDLLSMSTDLKSFLSNPLITSVVKKNILIELLSDQVNDFILKFLLVLIDRGRITLLTSIISKYSNLAYKLNSITIAKVSTSITLTEEQQEALISKLKEMTESKCVKLEINIDTSLIGGFMIQIGSKIIDTSLSGKLKQMTFYLKTN